MKNSLPNRIESQFEEKQTNKNLSADAEQLLQILDELHDFTAQLRKKLIAELKPEGKN